MKPSCMQRIQVACRLKGADTDRLREEAFRRGLTAGGLASLVVETWLKNPTPIEREEVAK